MFKVILLVLAISFCMYGMADIMGIITHVSAYSDAIALLLATLCYGLRSMLVSTSVKPMATRNK